MLTTSCVFSFILILTGAISKPLENYERNAENLLSNTNVISRMIFTSNVLDNYMRSKRSIAEKCEELELCRLHAQSGHSFMAAFQLYFVNKENARLWDHKQHSMSDCHRLYGGCVTGNEPETSRSKPRPIDYRARDDSEDVIGFGDFEDGGVVYE